MVERIEIHVGKGHGKPEVVLEGASAQILDFTQQNKTAVSQGNGGRVLVVAGAYNLRCLT